MITRYDARYGGTLGLIALLAITMGIPTVRELWLVEGLPGATFGALYLLAAYYSWFSLLKEQFPNGMIEKLPNTAWRYRLNYLVGAFADMVVSMIFAGMLHVAPLFIITSEAVTIGAGIKFAFLFLATAGASWFLSMVLFGMAIDFLCIALLPRRTVWAERFRTTT